MQTRTDHYGRLTSIVYTDSGRLDVRSCPDHTVSFDCDSRDNLESMTDPLGATVNTYDALNRLETTTDPNGFLVQYRYDAVGNVETLTYPGGKTVNYTYGELNRIDTVTIDWLGVTAAPEYDAAGRLDDLRDFNGTHTDYGYNAADRLVGLRHERTAGLLVDYGFQLDPNGNRESVTIQNEPILPAGLINDTIGGQSVGFGSDDQGLQTKDATTFSFDGVRRLTGYATNSYRYDGVGNRLIATRNGITTRYIYDAADNLLADANGSNQFQRYSIHGLRLMALVEVGTDQLYVYYFDGTGHTVAMTDADRNVVNRYAYDPYGRLLAEDETGQQPFTHLGQAGVMSEADGLYYVRARS